MKQFDILVAGEINPDLILTGEVVPVFDQVEKIVDSAALTIGSSSVIFACGAARFGLNVAFIGLCGDDLFGHFMLDNMSKRGVDVTNVIQRADGQTGLSVILNHAGDRALLTHPGLISALRAADIPDTLLRHTRHLHVASYFLQTSLQPDLASLFRRAHALGLSTSLDPNYDPSVQWSGFDELLAVTDIFLPNATEALSLTRAMDVDSAARQLAQVSKTVAVKLGSEGALACHENELTRVASIPVQAIDTTGAGDSFDAGFVYGFLHQWPLEKSLRLACVCGALSTRTMGGTDGQPTLAEAMKYVPG